MPEYNITKVADLKEGISLRPHQQRVVDNPNNGIIVAHATGSGKTLAAIARFEKLKSAGKAKKALVVVPASLRDNFGHEGVAKFTSSSYQIVGNKQEVSQGQYGKLDPSKDYNIVSYEMFRSNPSFYTDSLGADTLIVDEAHRGKNEETATLESLKDERPKFKNFIGLTGSVISNKISDVYPLVDLASGGKNKLGVKSKNEFEDKYLVRSSERAYNGLHRSRVPVVGFRHKKELGEEIGRYVDYMDSDDLKDVADMPTKKLSVKKVPMTQEQARIYKGILRRNPDVRKMIIKKRLETLKDDEVARLFDSMAESRKLMNSVGSVKPGMSLKESLKESPKTSQMIDDLADHLSKTKDGQAIVMSHLINGGTDILEEGLQEKHIPYGKFIGKGNEGVSEASRQQDVRDYNARKKKVMILSSAGGEGVSLNDTTWEGVLDPHYNPEKMKQMEARGIRSGGLSARPKEQRQVQVNRYMSVMPRRMFGMMPPQYKSPDEIIYGIAEQKDRQNKLLQNLMKENGRKSNMDNRRIEGMMSKKTTVEMSPNGNFKEKVASEIVGLLKLAAASDQIPQQAPMQQPTQNKRPDHAPDPYKTTKTVAKTQGLDVGLNVIQDLAAGSISAAAVGLGATAAKNKKGEDVEPGFKAAAKQLRDKYNIHKMRHICMGSDNYKKQALKDTFQDVKDLAKGKEFKSAWRSFKNSQKILIPAGIGIGGAYTLHSYLKDKKDHAKHMAGIGKTAAVIDSKMPKARPEDIPGTYWWVKYMLDKERKGV